jgi:hypothetical protein
MLAQLSFVENERHAYCVITSEGRLSDINNGQIHQEISKRKTSEELLLALSRAGKPCQQFGLTLLNTPDFEAYLIVRKDKLIVKTENTFLAQKTVRRIIPEAVCQTFGFDEITTNGHSTKIERRVGILE